MSIPVEELDLTDLSSTAVLLQSAVWGEFKADFGWEPHALRPAGGPWSGESILVLVRRLAPGITLAYVPHGPTLPPDVTRSGMPGSVRMRSAALIDLGVALCAALKVTPVCIRFDLLWHEDALTPEHGLRKAALDVQPSSTVLIDLSLSQEEMLGAMHKKHRYNIRLSNRKGVKIREGSERDLDRWYGLYRETAARDRIVVHQPRYYRRLFEIARTSIELSLHLYLAEHEDDLLAGIIVAEFAGQATYLYGASSDHKRNLMPNYALQWSAIRRASEEGLESYDLFGVPPAYDPTHPMHGLFRFKTGFGGRLLHRAGSWDVVMTPMRYNAYRIAERARSFYFHRMRKSDAR